jgi:outer membrane lipoprotein-sorting protein
MKKLLVLSLLLMAGTVLHAQTTATVSANLSDIATNAQSANATMRFRLTNCG